MLLNQPLSINFYNFVVKFCIFYIFFLYSFFLTILQHALVVMGRAGAATAHSLVAVAAADVNDNAPRFGEAAPRVSLIEEDDRDLPRVIARVGFFFSDFF